MQHGDIKNRIDEAITRLVSGTNFGNKTVVSIPVVYPSGSHAGIEIEVNGDNCFISDAGQGFSEAENYGASDFYKSCAKESSKRFGTSYDGLNMFVLRTSIENMEAAIVAVANASAIAARDAFEKAVSAKNRHVNSEIFDRFIEIFGKSKVEKVKEIPGHRLPWDVHNVVTLDNGTAIFEYVADHPNSISNKYMMFSDLKHNEQQPTILNAVVEDINKISQKGQLIVDVANNVVPFNASNHQFQKYASAA